MERISWHQYFMAQSHLLASRSTCERLSVGATIVRDTRIIAGGYNGSISGGVHCVDEGCYVIDGHCVRTIHAEMNAIIQCAKFGVKTEGADIYVTHFPCLNCCKGIIQAGISTVYYANDYKNHPHAVELFEQSGVKTEKVEFDTSSLNNYNDEQLAFIQELLQKADEKEQKELLEKAKKLFAAKF
ncbi:ComE operon protein 2 [Priestia endophytica]|uniref:ComE operon protein 2 n=1 Tax=Priestia endophytica TaxID=135735 RepID=A0AAX1Q998_9BACI|nr:ComE operon protein 2 [Priestia endophytica]RAS77890.1 ComE operon protein 2 [Priestia endophytica]RAS92759.1 ComE operon protein 2 [Priestia endophytica]